MIAILDYGAGNLQSVQNALHDIGAPFQLVDEPEALAEAGKIILPGVGHFGQMIRSLDAMRVRSVLLERLRAGVPFLGICLGLHALFQSSEEAPDAPGLGLFQGSVRRFEASARVPHMGWNRLEYVRPSRLLRGVEPPPYVYFAHSYYVPKVPAAAAVCDYTVRYTALLEQDNVFGAQFHPEKSGNVGLDIVRNFVEL